MPNPFALFGLFGKRARASRANERARELDALGRTDEAVDEYLRARAIDPKWSVPDYNLGLLYKYRRDWARSIDHNLRATQLAPDDEAGWWNLGIAATALGRWDIARSAWRGAGIDVPDGDGPIDYPCGRVPVRLNPDRHAEVVWSRRVDPVRAQIENIPLPESGFRYGDLVLHDGAGTGRRKLNDREVPVFNCLQLLRPSGFSTWVLEVELGADAPTQTKQMDLLEELAKRSDLAAEDWSSSIRMLCKACSEGRPYGDHEHPAGETGPHRRVAVVGPDRAQVEQLIENWRSQTEDVTLRPLELALDAAV